MVRRSDAGNICVAYTWIDWDDEKVLLFATNNAAKGSESALEMHLNRNQSLVEEHLRYYEDTADAKLHLFNSADDILEGIFGKNNSAISRLKSPFFAEYFNAILNIKFPHWRYDQQESDALVHEKDVDKFEVSLALYLKNDEADARKFLESMKIPSPSNVEGIDGMFNSFFRICNQAQNYSTAPRFDVDIGSALLFDELAALIIPLNPKLKNLWANLADFRVAVRRYVLCATLKLIVDRTEEKDWIKRLASLEDTLKASLLLLYQEKLKLVSESAPQLAKMVTDDTFVRFATLARSRLTQVIELGEPTEIGDLHAEIKLYLYMKQLELPTLNAKFYVSKPMCSNCACFFYGAVPDDERPSCPQIALDHFQCRFHVSCDRVDAAFAPHKVTHFC